MVESYYEATVDVEGNNTVSYTVEIPVPPEGSLHYEEDVVSYCWYALLVEISRSNELSSEKMKPKHSTLKVTRVTTTVERERIA